MKITHTYSIAPPFDISEVGPTIVKDRDGSFIARCANIFVAERIVDALNHVYFGLVPNARIEDTEVIVAA